MSRGNKIWQASSRRNSPESIHSFRIHSTVSTEFTHFFSLICWLFIFSSMDFVDNNADSTFTAVFEIPGIKTSDISLHIVDGHLVVSGERRATYNIDATQQSEASAQNTAENANQEPKFLIPIQELRFGNFRRAVRIPEGLKVRFSWNVRYQPSTHIFFRPYQSATRLRVCFYFYRNQKSKPASMKACWQSHGPKYLLQPYAQDGPPARAPLLQVPPCSNLDILFASEKKGEFINSAPFLSLFPTLSFSRMPQICHGYSHMGSHILIIYFMHFFFFFLVIIQIHIDTVRLGLCRYVFLFSSSFRGHFYWRTLLGCI